MMREIVHEEAPARRGFGRRVLRWLRRGLFALMALVLAGFLFETVMLAGDPARYPAPGEIVSVEGYPMHIRCVGSGTPTVVLVGGGGALSIQNIPLQELLSPYARTCVYDRAGYAWSAPRPEPRTAWQLMAELHALLQSAQVAPPFVLVGASNGGLYARAYAWLYPDEAAGLVMLDARLESDLGKGGSLPTSILQGMGRLGMFRLFPGIICPGDACNAQYREQIAVFRGHVDNLTTHEREMREGLDGSPEQIALLNERLGAPGTLGDTPLVVLQANQTGQPLEALPLPYREYVERYRAHHAALSTDTRYLLVNSGHGIADEHPEVVIDSVRDVLAAAQ